MYFQHAPEIWQEFPHLVPGLLVVGGIHSRLDVRDHTEQFYQRARERLAGTTESALPEIAAWRRAYAKMGMKPTQYRSAAEALLRRVRNGKDIPKLHPLVDLCNAVSTAFALPVAAIDLGAVADFLEVRRASGTERYLSFRDEIEQPEADEVIFADAEEHAHARRWTFRQSKRSTVHDTTERVLIVSEGLHESAADDVPALIDTLERLIGALWAPATHTAILTAESPRLSF